MRREIYSLAAAATVGIKLHPAIYPDPAPFQLPDPRQPAHSLTALAASPGQAPTSQRATSAHGSGCILDSVNYELATYSLADLVRLSESRFTQGTGSLLSLLARFPSGVLACLALSLASDFVRDRLLSLESTPSRIGSSAWFFSCTVWVSFLLSGLAEVKPRWPGPPPSTRVLLLFLRFLSLASFSGRVKLGASFWPSFSHLSLNPSTDLIFHSAQKKKNWAPQWQSQEGGLGPQRW